MCGRYAKRSDKKKIAELFAIFDLSNTYAPHNLSRSRAVNSQ
jgi:hypothetical protein